MKKRPCVSSRFPPSGPFRRKAISLTYIGRNSIIYSVYVWAKLPVHGPLAVACRSITDCPVPEADASAPDGGAMPKNKTARRRNEKARPFRSRREEAPYYELYNQVSMGRKGCCMDCDQ